VATFKSGAKSSEVAARFDLIPRVALADEAKRWHEGAIAHGENNYQRGICTDPEFKTDRLNHMMTHLLAYMSGDRSDDHMSAIRCGAGMVKWADAQTAKGYDDARAEPVKCRCGRMVNRPEQCDGPPCPFDRVPHQAVGDATGEPG
jgi:hypothetical protein